MAPHWQPKDSKAAMADDVREWIQRTSDPDAQMKSLEHMTTRDLTDLMLAVHNADRLTNRETDKP